MPGRWSDGGLPGFAGRIRFIRRFGLPSGLAPDDRVWLTFASFADRAEITLNGRSLGVHESSTTPLDLEVTSLLQPRNELRVEVEGSAETGGLTGEVALEIRCSAYLRNVRVTTGTDGRLRIQGEVVGTAERSLEIYAVLDRFTVAYGMVEPALGGRPFVLISDAPAQPSQAPESVLPVVGVDLVNGASVWYQCEVPIEPP